LPGCRTRSRSAGIGRTGPDRGDVPARTFLRRSDLPHRPVSLRRTAPSLAEPTRADATSRHPTDPMRQSGLAPADATYRSTTAAAATPTRQSKPSQVEATNFPDPTRQSTPEQRDYPCRTNATVQADSEPTRLLIPYRVVATILNHPLRQPKPTPSRADATLSTRQARSFLRDQPDRFRFAPLRRDSPNRTVSERHTGPVPLMPTRHTIPYRARRRDKPNSAHVNATFHSEPNQADATIPSLPCRRDNPTHP